MEKLDPITFAVIRNNLIAIANDMQEIAFRCAVTTLFYETIDCAFAILDSNTSLIAQSHGLPLFAGTLGPATKNCIDMIGKENLKPGDVIISTVPDITGSHQSDAFLTTPIIHDGEVFGYAVCKAHWSDVGAKNAFPTDSRSVYEEGILIPPVKIISQGKLQTETWQILKWNSRAPEAVWGDMQAQIMACHFAEDRITGLIAKYGKNTVSKCIEEIYDYSEEMTRLAIKEMPDGTWTAEDYLDDNGIDIGKPVLTKVTITIQGSDIIIDFTGSAPEQRGPLNSRWISTQSAVWGWLKTVTTSQLPINQGCFRPVKIIAPEHSVFNAIGTTPSFLYAWTATTIIELLNKALYQTLPKKIPACSGGDVCCTAFSGIDAITGKYWLVLVAGAVGQGADYQSDGENHLYHHAASSSRNCPAELLEIVTPLNVESVEFVQDSGGVGKFRGGLASRTSIRLNKPATFLSTLEKGKAPHWGLFGGKEGLRNYTLIHSNEKGVLEQLKGAIDLEEGDRVEIIAGGGGGYGDPLEREPELVWEDIINGYISEKQAREDYGVVIDTQRLAIDLKATKILRENLKSKKD